MTSQSKNTLIGAQRQAAIHELHQERMKLNIRLTFITVLAEEVKAIFYQNSRQKADQELTAAFLNEDSMIYGL